MKIIYGAFQTEEIIRSGLQGYTNKNVTLRFHEKFKIKQSSLFSFNILVQRVFHGINYHDSWTQFEFRKEAWGYLDSPNAYETLLQFWWNLLYLYIKSFFNS